VGGVAGSGEKLFPNPAEFLGKRGSLGKILFSKTAPSIGDTNSKSRSDFLRQLTGELTQVQLQASYQEERPPEQPLFSGGLVPSRDGLHWETA
jgi:halogenation protein CepH